MRPIAPFSDLDTLHRTRRLLRGKRVPTHARTVASRAMGWRAVPHVRMAEDVDDALRPIRDPHHRAAHPVDAVAFKAALDNPDPGILARATAIALLQVIAMFAVALLAWWRYGR